MPSTFQPSSAVGAYVPTSNIWDVAALYAVDVNSNEFKELLVRLYQNITNIANVLNIKDSGYYDTLEFVNGQMFFPLPGSTSQTEQQPFYRNVRRKVINFGALPNAGTKTVAHGITTFPVSVIEPVTPGTTFTRIYACASDTTGQTYIPIPYASTTAVANQVELFVDSTNVTIKTGTNRSNFNVCTVVLEFLQT